MRYEAMVASGYAIRKIPLPIVNVPHGVQQGTDEQRKQWEADGKPEAPVCGMRVLSPGEDIEVDRLAEAFAKTQGVEKYDDVHPICVKARMVYTLATACVDPDTDSHAPLLFFGDTVEQAARTLFSDPKRVLTPDTVVYLHEVYEIWKDAVNPQANTIADYQLAEMARKAADDADFLALLRPGLRLKFTHILATLCANLPELSFGLSCLSNNGVANSPKTPSKPSVAKARPRPRKVKRK